MLFLLRQLLRREDGQGLVEYGLIIALVALVVIGALMALGGQLSTTFGDIVGKLTGGDG
jgi:pilus assembly protein Flp/PilA